MKLKDTPIKRKLISVIMLTCSLVLFLTCTAYIGFEFYTSRDVLKKNLKVLGRVVASNSAGALVFNSQKDAREILHGLASDPHVVCAALYDQNGKLFVSYPDSIPRSDLPLTVSSEGYEFHRGFLEGFQPVVQKNEFLGTLYVKSELDLLYTHLNRIGYIAAFLIFCSLAIAYLVAYILQKSISSPILSLKETAISISQIKDFSVRAKKQGNDEVGALTDSFNQMLHQIELQTLEIGKAELERAKMAAIVESSDDAIVSKTLDGIITSWNAAAERIFGYEAEEIIGKSIYTIIPTHLYQEELTIISKLNKGERIGAFETQRLTKDGALIDLSLTVSPIRNASGTIVGASKIAHDVTAQKRRERQIIKNEEHLRLATHAAELGTFDMDLLNDSLEWDQRCRELFGIYSAGQFSYEDLLNSFAEEDKIEVVKALKGALDVRISEGNYDLEFKAKGIEDQRTRWIKAKGKVFFDEADQPVRMIGIVLDVTDKKQEEIRKNDFIAIVSHELKTPLTSIKAYLQLIQKHASKTTDLFASNTSLRAGVQVNKMTAMIQDFLSLARLEEGKLQLNKERFDLCVLIQEIASEATFLSAGQSITVTHQPPLFVQADKEKIGQVLVNLLSNAIKYSPSDTEIHVNTMVEGKKIKVSVIDQGVGISQQDQKKLFARFSRIQNDKMKNVSGFGIGLYVVSEILRYHQSKIEVLSEEDKGSVFYFYLDQET